MSICSFRFLDQFEITLEKIGKNCLHQKKNLGGDVKRHQGRQLGQTPNRKRLRIFCHFLIQYVGYSMKYYSTLYQYVIGYITVEKHGTVLELNW